MSYSDSLNKHKEEIIIQSKDKHQFFISKNAIMLCPGLFEVYNKTGKNQQGNVVITMNNSRKIIEIFLDFIYFKMRHLSDDYERLPNFDIPAHLALELYELGKAMGI